MDFKHKTSNENLGFKIGFLLSYFIFTTILFYLLTFLSKVPSDWNYLNIMSITAGISILGIVIKRLLK